MHALCRFLLCEFGPQPRICWEIMLRRYERCTTLVTSKRPVEDWGKLPGDVDVD